MFSAATEREEFPEGASVGVVVTAARRTAAAVGRRRRRRGRHDVHVVCRRAPRNLALSQSQRRVDVNTGATGPKLTLAARGQSRGTAAGTQRIVSLGYAAAGPALRWSASRRQQLKHEIPRFSALNLMTLVRIRLSRGKYYRHRNSVLSYHFNVYISGITH